MAFDEELRTTFETLTARIRDEIASQVEAVRREAASQVDAVRSDADVARSEADALRSEVDAVRGELRASELAAADRLAAAIRAMDQARSLSEILDTLASCAGREAARVAVLLVRGPSLRGWRFIGFGQPLDETTEFDVPLEEAGAIADAVRTGTAASADNGAPAFAQLPAGRELLALPVSVSGQVVAVLYADQGANAEQSSVVSHQSVISRQSAAWPATLEVMSRHAARCLEAITAFRAAKVLTERSDVSASSASHAHQPVASASADGGEDEEGARRYARLLISEIKLYHEAEVANGRREQDLTKRLGGEIARARVLYEQRVPVAVRKSVDYFQEELVRTLANGDASLL